MQTSHNQTENAPKQKRRPRAGKHTRFLTQAAMIAAIYAALTYACAILTQGMFRIGEAMMILPFFTPSAIPGLFIGYFILKLAQSLNALSPISVT